MARLGDVGGILHSEIKSCALARCMEMGRQQIGWDQKYPRVRVRKTMSAQLALPLQPIAPASRLRIRPQ